MKKLLIFTYVLMTLSFMSCVKNATDINTVPNDPSSKTTKDLTIPASFDFRTTKEVSLGILVRNPYSTISGVPVSVFLDNPGTSEVPNTTARFFGTFVSQSDGRIDARIKLPASQDSLYLTTKYIGLEGVSGFTINGTTASYTYGKGNSIKSASLASSSSSQLKASYIYSFLSTYNNLGVPGNLFSVNDPISKGMLDSLSATVQERLNLPVKHPEYFTGKSAGNIVFKEDSYIWITFVSEGASNLNSVGYYIYDPKNPPKYISTLDLKIIFPNTSFGGSGGGLLSGNKVQLGPFTAGQAIGWFLVGSGWNGSTVNGSMVYFSDPSLNTDYVLNSPTKGQHTVVFNDNGKSNFYLGFEDGNYAGQSTDYDFNDAIFRITVGSATIIQDSNIALVEVPVDSDKDGIIDCLDEFPNDANGVSSKYYPGKDEYTTLLVEDLWPSLGDFDFNDLVVDCNFKSVLNAQSNVVGMYIKYKVRAIGASFKNGFGIQLPLSPTAISSVTSWDSTTSFVEDIGLEPGNDKAVVIAFNNAFTRLPSTGGSGVNVIKGNAWSKPKEVELHIVFASPQTEATLGNAPYNPFVFVDGDRTKEIHLTGSQPTSKANLALLGTGNDSSNPATGKYYKSTNNLVWMIEVPSSFQYAIEKNDITKAYLKFGAWAESGGSQYPDWYMDKPGYRESSLIY